MSLKEAIDNCLDQIERQSMSIAGGYLPHNLKRKSKISQITVDDIYFGLQRLYNWRVDKRYINDLCSYQPAR